MPLSYKETPSESDTPVRVSEAPTTTTRTTNMSKNLFGVLKEISNVMPPIKDGMTSEEPELQPVTPEAGEEAKDEFSSETDETAGQNSLTSIPIIQLDPAEIAPLVIEPQAPRTEILATSSCMQELKLPTTSASDAGQVDDSANCPAGDDEIIFASVRKKVKKKKPKSELLWLINRPLL